MNYKVGQRVYVEGRFRENITLVVASVGKRWVKFDSIAGRTWKAKIGSTALIEEGFGAIGRIWESETQWLEDRRQRKNRETLQTQIKNSNWYSLSLEQLEAIKKIIVEG